MKCLKMDQKKTKKIKTRSLTKQCVYFVVPYRRLHTEKGSKLPLFQNKGKYCVILKLIGINVSNPSTRGHIFNNVTVNMI